VSLFVLILRLWSSTTEALINATFKQAALPWLVGGLGFAAPCTNGTLAAYISLRSTGCTIGSLLLKDFTYLHGGSSRPANEVMVTVILDPHFAGPDLNRLVPALGIAFSTYPRSWEVEGGRVGASVTPGITYTVVATAPAYAGLK
jgi:hypothetical protein